MLPLRNEGDPRRGFCHRLALSNARDDASRATAAVRKFFSALSRDQSWTRPSAFASFRQRSLSWDASMLPALLRESVPEHAFRHHAPILKAWPTLLVVDPDADMVQTIVCF